MLIVATLLHLQPPSYRSRENIEVVILDKSPRKKQQFVTDPEALRPLKNALNELKRKADFLSRETRRVREQMVARKTGRTQNQAPTARRAFPKPQEATDLNGNQPAFNHQRVAERVVLSDSTLAEHIPDVKRGGFTSLNTDQFMFYTFYARINEQIRNRWVSNLRAFSDSTGPHELNRLAQREQITELEILLDKDGNYKKTIVHRRSENHQLDAAAAYAISHAAPFLNPPSEIVAEDGFIHLYYQFHVQWRPQYVAGPRN